MKILEFDDAAAVSDFYDRRFAVGYMDAVSAETVERIAMQLREAKLSVGQRVLDFGCGVGHLTAALAAQCPGVVFAEGNKTRRPPAAAIKAQVHAMEEKGSDVNLACHLIHDGWAGHYDSAVVISNDTDLVEPIRIVVQELKKSVTLLCPSSFGASKPLAAVASSVRHIHPAHLKASVFSDTLPGTTISKPTGW